MSRPQLREPDIDALSDRRLGPFWAVAPRGMWAALVVLCRHSAHEMIQVVGGGVRHARWRRRRGPIIRQYLAAHTVRKLQLGSGPVVLPGWLNADLRPRTSDHVFIDALDRLPFDDDAIDYILSEHMIGDFTYQECARALAECLRVLRPGGRLRLSTPDLERLSSLYDVPRSSDQDHYLRWSILRGADWPDVVLPGLTINNMFQDYAFVYDRDVLTHLLRTAGFVDIAFFPAGESDSPALRGVDSHGGVVGDDRINRFEVLTVEAAKAGATARPRETPAA